MQNLFFCFGPIAICLLRLVFCEETTEPLWIHLQEEKYNSSTSVPSPIVKSSSVINMDGSFEFSLMQDPNAYILIRGSVRDVNGTKTLSISGRYRHETVSIYFSGNEEEGFKVYQVYAVPSKVISTILG